MNEFKKWWQSKTLWFADALTYIGTGLEVVIQYEPDVRAILMPYLGAFTGLILIAIGITFRILRFKTTKGIQ